MGVDHDQGVGPSRGMNRLGLARIRVLQGGSGQQLCGGTANRVVRLERRTWVATEPSHFCRR
jgi:hypothetical protein